jgi:hypothetical protein
MYQNKFKNGSQNLLGKKKERNSASSRKNEKPLYNLIVEKKYI